MNEWGLAINHKNACFHQDDCFRLVLSSSVPPDQYIFKLPGLWIFTREQDHHDTAIAYFCDCPHSLWLPTHGRQRRGLVQTSLLLVVIFSNRHFPNKNYCAVTASCLHWLLLRARLFIRQILSKPFYIANQRTLILISFYSLTVSYWLFAWTLLYHLLFTPGSC